MDLGAMAITGDFTFLKAPALLDPHHQNVSVISRTLVGRGFLPFGKMQPVYSSVLADWAWILFLFDKAKSKKQNVLNKIDL